LAALADEVALVELAEPSLDEPQAASIPSAAQVATRAIELKSITVSLYEFKFSRGIFSCVSLCGNLSVSYDVSLNTYKNST
jgi:hypothetical protein